MQITCRQCRRVVGGKWSGHKGCLVVLSEEVPEGVVVELERIKCSGCRRGLGRVRWWGSKCTCGRWVFPYIAINLSDVDLS
ncbi:hypothetical protein NEHOM01_1511 [Nematocida homosporus]|uniref:uncharacterized protein n=1 Tax=Nematocida homosporus TaxID=1912981 RepID=UPI0022209E21|nr:uncharacterized protein NEHOM01_1511 [Nematocida homosporus]KAI5186511.1 hypothetical protein NEHOM01_1511 [Nematocida homosporus]